MIWSLVAISTLLLALPSDVLADRGPFKELDPPYALTDPEVPDGRMPSRVAGVRPSAVVDDEVRITDTRAAVRENLLERILRVLRALALGGSVR
jgi:hypothetical protein